MSVKRSLDGSLSPAKLGIEIVRHSTATSALRKSILLDTQCNEEIEKSCT